MFLVREGPLGNTGGAKGVSMEGGVPKPSQKENGLLEGFRALLRRLFPSKTLLK